MKQEYAHSIAYDFVRDDIEKMKQICWKVVRILAGIFEDIWYGLSGRG